ncbi:hypothetical protein BKP37_07160 [Anaerobacillus alkalilacustris]|uniref:Uncharacterized protein n=1 Tax=Anaerobacillus alkalilacustris TaxID=393763 RepID=A0A1S2LQG9_9BACI|nr:hypothetical protein [Anaerobacillus alkalilacustris]OIJ14751.1 hypothetical protein BKP37_07160 [Anaerobacillus alkalilacustris]
MDAYMIAKYSFISLVKGIAVALATLFGILFSQPIILLLRFDFPEHPILLANINSTLLFICIIILTSILVGELVKKLNQPILERFVFIFVYHYFFFHLVRAIDGYISNLNNNVIFDLVSHIIPSLVFAFTVSLLWKPERELISIRHKAKEYFSATKVSSWIWKFWIGALCFVPIYLVTDSLISPFVAPYYTDLANILSTSPSLLTLLMIKLAIGLLSVLVLMPIFVMWTGPKASLLFWSGFPIFVQAAVYPSIVEVWLPLGMRFPYLIKYTVITYLLAIIFVQLFFVPHENEVIDDQFNWMY